MKTQLKSKLNSNKKPAAAKAAADKNSTAPTPQKSVAAMEVIDGKAELVDENAPLTQQERQRLALLERTVEQGLAQFVSTGQALAQIQVEKLWRGDHKSFEDYLQQKWGYAKAHGYRLINAARLMTETLKKVHCRQLPCNETQVRPLLRLKSEQDRVKAWKAAAKSAGKARVTQQIVAEAVTKIVGEPLSSRKVQRKAKLSQSARARRDGLRTAIGQIKRVLNQLPATKPNKPAINSLQQVVKNLEALVDSK